MAKQPTPQLSIEQQIETAMQRAAELQRAHEQALVAGEPTADILKRHGDALDEARRLKSELAAEQRAAKEAAAAAELDSLAPRLSAEITATLKPLQARVAQGFSIEAPPMPKVDQTHLIAALRGRDSLADAERQLQDCHVRGERLAGRIEALQAERAALVERRAQGEQRQDDAAQLALMDADLAALGGLLESTETQYRALKIKRDSAQKESATVDNYWVDEQKRVMAEFYESVAKRVELLLAECFEQQAKNAYGFQHAPAFHDKRVRRVAGLPPIDAVVSKNEPEAVTVLCRTCQWTGPRTALTNTAIGDVCPKCGQRRFSVASAQKLAA